MTPFPAFATPSPKIPFNNKGAANNGRIIRFCLSLTPFPKRLLPMKYPQALRIGK